MTWRRGLGVGIAGVLSLGLWALLSPTSPGYAAPEAPPRVTWEYESLQFHARQRPDDLLNERGSRGWELVSVADMGENWVRYVLKRPRQPEPARGR